MVIGRCAQPGWYHCFDQAIFILDFSREGVKFQQYPESFIGAWMLVVHFDTL
jgi:hypothetical protein